MRLARTQTNTVVSQAILGSGTARYSRRSPMPPALTPELALDYLGELSADVRAGVVLAADGRRLAGPDGLAEPARRLLAALPDADEAEVSTGDGIVFAGRSSSHAVVLVCGRLALGALHRYDVRRVLGDLEDSGSDGPPRGNGPDASPDPRGDDPHASPDPRGNGPDASADP